ncbi:MAG: cation-translocating P-type ATPase [Deltaproteobacteria bacterium]|nr:cation-translocating P-type ATPase [Deltaproteobacteria bacterium]
MADSEKDNLKSCPLCCAPVDPLRAGAVSIVDGQMAYFCSADCREHYLQRDVDSVQADAETPVVRSVSISKVSDESARHSQSSKRDTAPPLPTTAADNGISLESDKGILPFLLWPHAAEAGILTAILLFNAVTRGRDINWIAAYVSIGVGILFSAGWHIWRERKNGPAIMLNSTALPLAATLLMIVAYFKGAPAALYAMAATGVLLLRSIGRIGEVLLRFQSNIAHIADRKGGSGQFSGWKDNSVFAMRIRKVASILNWARIPVSILSAPGLMVGAGIRGDDALMTSAMLLILFEPRLLRMVTGDAHLKVAIMATQMGGRIRDAHAVAQLGSAKTLLLGAKDILTFPDVRVVDWQICDGVTNPANVLHALYLVERGITNRYARAIVAFCRQQGIGAGHTGNDAVACEMDAGKGVSADTPYGQLHCGSREFMLANGISTGDGETVAEALAQSGRRALFVSLHKSLVAVFGIDEQIRQGVEAAVQRLSLMGIEPIMITSADMAAAQALGTRLGIDHVIVRSDAPDLESLLAKYRESDLPVSLLGTGEEFEQNVRHAACAVAVGVPDGKISLADVDMRGRTLGDVAVLMEWAIAAERSVRVNLFLTLLTIGIGICLAMGWHTLGMTLGVSLIIALVSVGCTLSGPYPMVRHSLNTVQRTVIAVLERIGLTKRSRN